MIIDNYTLQHSESNFILVQFSQGSLALDLVWKGIEQSVLIWTRPGRWILILIHL